MSLPRTRLQAVDLSFGYGRRVVGGPVGFDFSAGEVLCLLGPNGGGKTTLFKTLLGLLPSLGGDTTLDGASLRRMKRADIARAVGYVPQAHSGYFPFSVEDVVLMGRTAHLSPFAQPGANDRRAAREALERLGIGDLERRIYTQLSGGQRQLVLIARALAGNPRLLIMDEPTASLDFGNQVRVLQRIADLASQDVGILLSTHDPDHVFLCADRVALLAPTGKIEVGTPEGTMTPEALQRLYGVAIETRIVTAQDGIDRRICFPSRPAPRRP